MSTSSTGTSRFARELITFRPPLMSHRSTALLVLPVWLALVGFTLADHPIEGLLVALGAYVVLFGGAQPTAAR